jgi:hypothetical protein
MADIAGEQRQFYCNLQAKTKPRRLGGRPGKLRETSEVLFSMNIVSEDRLRKKRLKRLMGEDYYTKPALRLILSKLAGVQLVDDMDDGRPVEWNDLETERERKIAMVHFWKGFHYAEEWRKMEEELRERGEIE